MRDNGFCRLSQKVKKLSDIPNHYLSWAQSKESTDSPPFRKDESSQREKMAESYST